ncbi:MAG: hypothetical protein MUE69_15265 [Myxococcota bacterium]|jgi:hypothetical protein|nr:hypothetical protein [Myxococcota bacterium]
MSSREQAREMPGGARPIRWGIVGIVVAVGCVGAWLGAHQLRPVPPDPWESEAFAPAARAEENGLVIARSLPRAGDEPFEAWVDAGADGERAWDEATERLLGLREHVAPHRATMDEVDARPRFVEDCRPSVDAYCELVPAVRTMELAGLLALAEVAELPPYDVDPDSTTDHANDDRSHDADAANVGPANPATEATARFDPEAWARADARLARAVERARDFHASAYSLVGTMVGIALLTRSLDAAAPTVVGASRVGAPLPRLRAALAAPFENRTLRRGFLFDHRMMRTALLALPRGVFFDRARSAIELDERTTELLAYAEDPTRTPPSFPAHVEQMGWWLYDATGKEHLDMMAADGSRLVTQAIARQADAERARVALLAQFRDVE